MQVTDVRVRRYEGEGKVRAYCTILIDGVFAVHDIKVVEGTKGLFVAMPSRKGTDGEFRDVAHPVTAEVRDAIHSQVMTAYQEALLEKAG